MSLINMLEFKNIVDDRGSLVALEALRNIPFPIKRVYFLTGLDPAFPRGFHAHRRLRQVAICLSGACRFVLDDGTRREETILQGPDRGLVINAMVWREMYDFSQNCVLLILASEYYEEADYIRSYSDFLGEVI